MANVEEITSLMIGGADKKDEELITKAYGFAERAHEGQKRKSGEAYFIHLFETAKILATLGMDAQTIAGGLLHHVFEDTKISEKELERVFGPEILFLVEGSIKLGTLKYRGRERYAESLRQLFVAMAEDLRVVIIKFADRLHNLRTLKFIPEEKRKRIALESIDVYAPLANRLGMGKLKGEIEDAAFPYAYPEEYAQMEELINKRKVIHQKILFEAQKVLEKEFEKSNIKVVEIDHRVKRKYSLWKKLVKRGMDIEKIYDIIAFRVIVDSVEECYRVLGIIHSIWNPLPERIKDYVALPKPDGYSSIHTTVFTGPGKIIEFQIRTKEMHAKAAYGILARFTYRERDGKTFKNDKLKLKWIEELKGLNYTPDDPKSFIKNLKMDFFSDRIFVFTPNGDVVDLPEDSSPIDFAYSIHSDIGNHIFGAKINGKMSQIFTKLKNRDIVEIIKKKDARPSSKWLDNVKTALAKKNIKSFLEKNSSFDGIISFKRS
ncbi:MAG TPA: RelA/SpoT family protein [Candidatus Paceibacterota bacterium]|nr:RelA/SpoT family protein [Candidatus Paceibacterota bacterium]